MTGTIIDPNLMGKRFILVEILGEVVLLGGPLDGSRDVMYTVLVNDPGSDWHEELIDLGGRNLIFDGGPPCQ